MKQAEVAAYFRRFEEAERKYLDMDRRYEDQVCYNKKLFHFYIFPMSFVKSVKRGCRGRDHMVVFTNTYAISAYHH
jgi:WD repeat-containing protein 35